MHSIIFTIKYEGSLHTKHIYLQYLDQNGEKVYLDGIIYKMLPKMVEWVKTRIMKNNNDSKS